LGFGVLALGLRRLTEYAARRGTAPEGAPVAPDTRAPSRQCCYDGGQTGPGDRLAEVLMATRVRLMAVIAALSSVTLACSSGVEIGGTYDKTADFSRYHTYGFRPDRQLGEEYRQRQAERTIADVLGSKGFKYEAAKPDLLIGLTPFADPTMSADKAPAGTLAWDAWGAVVGAQISTGGNVSVEAELTITFQDAQSRNIVWRGMAKGRVQVDNPKETSERVMRAIKVLLEGFPPKPK
jgi:hypothetical protein